MNFLEAIKSGRPIRRTGRSVWTIQIDGCLNAAVSTFASRDEWMSIDYYLDTIRPRKEDILADDWEVKISAKDRLFKRIAYITRVSGRVPSVLDVPLKDMQEICADISHGVYVNQVCLYSPEGEVRIIESVD